MLPEQRTCGLGRPELKADRAEDDRHLIAHLIEQGTTTDIHCSRKNIHGKPVGSALRGERDGGPLDAFRLTQQPTLGRRQRPGGQRGLRRPNRSPKCSGTQSGANQLCRLTTMARAPSWVRARMMVAWESPLGFSCLRRAAGSTSMARRLISRLPILWAFTQRLRMGRS